MEDRKDIEEGRSADCDGNGILDECDLGPDGWILERKAGAALDNNGERLIVADMDADGHVDAVAVNRNPHRFIIVFNDGSGEFDDRREHSLGTDAGERFDRRSVTSGFT